MKFNFEVSDGEVDFILYSLQRSANEISHLASNLQAQAQRAIVEERERKLKEEEDKARKAGISDQEPLDKEENNVK